jgi:hypothetical protein
VAARGAVGDGSVDARGGRRSSDRCRNPEPGGNADVYGAQGFPVGPCPGYRPAQVAGTVLAALLLRGLFGNAGHLGAILPHHGHSTSLVMAIVRTSVLVTIILGTADAHRIVGHNAALAVAATIALRELFASSISRAPMNQARLLGPELIAGHDGQLVDLPGRSRVRGAAGDRLRDRVSRQRQRQPARTRDARDRPDRAAGNHSRRTVTLRPRASRR